MPVTRTIPITRQLRDDNDNLVPLQAWRVESLTALGSWCPDGQDRWTIAATVTLYTDGVYGIARRHGPDVAHARGLDAALICAEGVA